MLPTMTYKDSLRNSCDAIAKSRDLVFTAMVNVAMSGEYKGLDEQFEEDEEILFDTAYFRNCEDLNVQKLLALVDTIEKTYDSLVNINGFDAL